MTHDKERCETVTFYTSRTLRDLRHNRKERCESLTQVGLYHYKEIVRLSRLTQDFTTIRKYVRLSRLTQVGLYGTYYKEICEIVFDTFYGTTIRKYVRLTFDTSRTLRDPR